MTLFQFEIRYSFFNIVMQCCFKMQLLIQQLKDLCDFTVLYAQSWQCRSLQKIGLYVNHIFLFRKGGFGDYGQHENRTTLYLNLKCRCKKQHCAALSIATFISTTWKWGRCMINVFAVLYVTLNFIYCRSMNICIKKASEWYWSCVKKLFFIIHCIDWARAATKMHQKQTVHEELILMGVKTITEKLKVILRVFLGFLLMLQVVIVCLLWINSIRNVLSCTLF